MPLIGESLASSTIVEGTKSAAAAAKNDEDLNKFLNLLVTQLKNQDPLDPMDATEFTSQLVQFASVEQQIYANANLEKILKLQETNQVSNLVDLIGKTVEAEGRDIPLENANAQFTYTVPIGARKATVSIANDAGVNVFTVEGDITEGQHTFKWDGKSTSGNQKLDGDYKVTVSATDTDGNLMDITYTSFGRVSGVGIVDGVLSLNMGESIIYGQENIRSVKETVVVEQ
jgi:flagellar basal-body rod modification protein FlgD